jgi:hypothetical protein
MSGDLTEQWAVGSGQQMRVAPCGWLVAVICFKPRWYSGTVEHGGYLTGHFHRASL